MKNYLQTAIKSNQFMQSIASSGLNEYICQKFFLYFK